MSTSESTEVTTPNAEPIFTCLSCAIAFVNAEEQREHYRSDHHRYNMKRRVAGLPPVNAIAFNQKVMERRAETALTTSPKGSTCEICSKTYTTENAYRSHIQSKKHKEAELKALSAPQKPSSSEVKPKPAPATQPAPPVLAVSPDATEEEIEEAIDAKIAAARTQLTSAHCLFCPILSTSLATSLEHMSSAHSFFIPDAEYLVDLPGLIRYLGEKLAIGNVCIYCNAHSREFRTLDAVRKHMMDKGHCKIAYENERDMLEVSDYYDFSSSYPDAAEHAEKQKAKAEGEEGEEVVDEEEDGEGQEWEDVESGEEEEEESEEDDQLPSSGITFGDSSMELVLPSGARIGHRSMRRYYAQNFRPSAAAAGNGNTKPVPHLANDPNSGAALVRRLIADKNSALVPSKGGFGAFGSGLQVVKARNRGEAREAGRHTKEFRDVNRREQFKTKVAFIGNNQKHFRDPLLQ